MRRFIAIVFALLLLVSGSGLGVPPSTTLEDKIRIAFAGVFADIASEATNTANHKERVVVARDMALNANAWVDFYSRSLASTYSDNDSTTQANVKSHVIAIFSNVVTAKVLLEPVP